MKKKPEEFQYFAASTYIKLQKIKLLLLPE